MKESSYYENLVKRYAKLFHKIRDYYAMDYGSRFKPYYTDKNKIKYVNDENGKRPYWYVPNELQLRTYWEHLQDWGKKENKGYIDWGLIMPPLDEEGNVSFGAVDIDIYDDPKELKRIVSTLYELNLPIVPCYSKSGGLHLYLFFKTKAKGSLAIKYLKHVNKILKAKSKEIFPKQEKLKWNEKKKKYAVGNGILLPYKSVIHHETGEYTRSDGIGWIKNKDMETGTLEEFIDYAESKSLDPGDLPLDIIEKEVKKVDPIFEQHTRTFEELGARPLNEGLEKILKRIRDKKEHSRGGKFDNHIVDFVYGAVEESYSDKEIKEHFDSIKEYDEPGYIEEKIKKCREKFGKKDPGEHKNIMMSNLIFNKSKNTFRDQSTGGEYKKDVVETIYSHLFGKRGTAINYFNNNPNKQMAEFEIYRPDLYEEGKQFFKNKKDNLYYINKYKPGNYPPIKPLKQSDIQKWEDMLEHIIVDKENIEYVLDWCAYLVQYPWSKIHSIILIYTKHERMGKGSIFEVMTDILGETNAEPTDINGLMDKGVSFAEKQLVLVDEMKTKGTFSETKHVSNALKKIGTERRIQQRKLYVDYHVIETETNYMIFTNVKDALNLDNSDDRFFIIANTNVRKPQKFYDDFHKWRIEKGSSFVHYVLMNRDISKFNPKAPPPRTKAKQDMIDQVGHPLTLVLIDWIREGHHPFPLDQSVRGSIELQDWISKHGRGDYVKFANNPKILATCLEEAGCIKLGQIHNEKFNNKPTLWIYSKHEEIQKLKPKDICNSIWKPLITSHSRQDDSEQRSTDDLNNRPADDWRNKEFEQQLNGKGRETNCWSCHTPISESIEGVCPECDYAIKCGCGMCACDKPGSKIKKKGAYVNQPE